MKNLFLLAALAATLILSGCGRTSARVAQAPRVTGYGAITTAGFKPPSQVEPCCADMATGRISVDQCFARPACKAKNNTCCMNAMQDIKPASI